MTSYAITKRDIIGTTAEPEADYDLMNVIMIRRGIKEGKEAIFDYLSGIFTSSENKVSQYVDIDRNEKVKEDFNRMSGLGMSIAAKNYDMGVLQGIQQGMQQGIQKGMQQGEDSVLLLMQKLFEAGRVEEAKQITTDKELRKRLKIELSV